jgi:tryptophan halogenase
MKIVIVGGGTAGWIAAFYILKSQPNIHKVTVIESSDIGIIGAGEGATHILGNVLNGKSANFGLDTKDFIIKTDATFKQGTKYVNWAKSPSTYYNPLDLNFLKDPKLNDYLALQILNDNPIHAISELGMFIDEKRSVVKKDETGLSETDGFSYHFDGHKVGRYFKEQVLQMGAECIDATVENVVQDTHGVSSLDLRLHNIEVPPAPLPVVTNLLEYQHQAPPPPAVISDKFNIEGDFFIDCTGFAKILIDKLNPKWISYKDHLLLNSALPFFLPYGYGDGSAGWPEPITATHAMSAGWAWQIPTLERYGCGYVFCEEFISFEQAELELAQYFKHEIKPIKRIKFEPGRHQTPWFKNCLALGLASAFIEPLEATSIHASTIQLTKFIENLKITKEETCNQNVIDRYNTEVGAMYDDIKDFIILHYLGGKQDTPFWKHISNLDISTDLVKHVLEITKHRLLTEKDIPNPENSIGHQAWNQILAGLGFISKDVARAQLAGKEEIIKAEYESWKLNRIQTMERECKTNIDVTLKPYFSQ